MSMCKDKDKMGSRWGGIEAGSKEKGVVKMLQPSSWQADQLQAQQTALSDGTELNRIISCHLLYIAMRLPGVARKLSPSHHFSPPPLLQHASIYGRSSISSPRSFNDGRWTDPKDTRTSSTER